LIIYIVPLDHTTLAII